MSCISGIRRGIAEVAAYQRQQICRANSPAVHIAQRALSHAPHALPPPSVRSANPVQPQASRIEIPTKKVSMSAGETQYDVIEQLSSTLTSRAASVDERFSSGAELANMFQSIKFSPSKSFSFATLEKLSLNRNEPDLISHLFASYCLTRIDKHEEVRMREFVKSEKLGWGHDNSDLDLSIRYALRHKRLDDNFEEWSSFARSNTDHREVRLLRNNLFSVFADVVLADTGLSQRAMEEISYFWCNSDLNYWDRIPLAASIQKIAINDPNRFHEMVNLLTQLPKDLDKKFSVKKLTLLTLIQMGKATTDPKNTLKINHAIELILDHEALEKILNSLSDDFGDLD